MSTSFVLLEIKSNGAHIINYTLQEESFRRHASWQRNEYIGRRYKPNLLLVAPSSVVLLETKTDGARPHQQQQQQPVARIIQSAVACQLAKCVLAKRRQSKMAA
jgi:hypothetical protein